MKKTIGKKKKWIGYFPDEYDPMMAFNWKETEHWGRPSEITLEPFAVIFKKKHKTVGKKIRITVEVL